jgi:uncharacterized membrane protein YebE (DUF533 family)
MFDARSLLETLVKGASPQPAQQAPGGLGPLGDILGKMIQGGGAGQQAPQGGGGLGPLADILGKMMPGGGAGQPQQQPHMAPPAGGGQGGGFDDMLRRMAPGGGGERAPQGGGGLPGGLGDILGQLQKQLGAGSGQPGAQAPGQGGGGLMDILGQVLGQATSGVKEGARRIDDATGASGRMREAVGGATGQSPEELLAKLQEWVAQNKLGAGAAAGGLGAVVLGTRTGRAVAGSALRIGALALIGGLAYKAYQNYQQGRPLISGSGTASGLMEAPAGSGFEPGAVTNDKAILYIRAMIAAAAADGRIDANEQQRILGGLEQAGLAGEAREFIMHEIQQPATPEELAAQVTTGEEAVQLYTAARIAIDPDTQGEARFLGTLAEILGIDRQLAAHIDAAAAAA